MKLAPIPENEIERLRALYVLKILDTKPEEIYDRVTRIAAKLFDVPMSSICFVDEKRVWFKSKQGLNVDEIGRSTSICGHTINQNITDNIYSRIYEIQDMSLDPRFSDNPIVINKPNIKYYMSYILQSTSGANIGTLCIMDNRPRNFSQKDKDLLIDLGQVIDKQLKEVNLVNNFSIDDIAIASDVAYKVFDEMDELLRRKGINLIEWRVLDKVVESSFATPTQISKQLGLARPKVSKILEFLEANGLIKRLRSIENTDRRLVKLECNEEGRDIWKYGKRLGNQVVGKLGLQ